ncbi:GNAT family N-acetyltransferase [Streptomyces radicis]|uniref:GNAT family N-acetyltransferase n=2 Tax=Streptomyces radicis TaxID=1750517 RepID=A0A3A9W9F9_9ACTN|nr:GNAT family N-acetyltransferase [Streptomyces radicis]RKN17778.1 GNAT family N-acetyltransferase [Streptomyces radicis]
MASADLPFVVEEHLGHFPHGFFARLGAGFLTSYTRTYLTGPEARAYVVEAAGRPVGFLVGVLDPPAHRRHVLRSHGPRLAARALVSLAVRPRLARHFLRTRLLRYLRGLLPRRAAPGAAPAANPGVTAVLSHVVVTRSARSLGIGETLIGRFVADAAVAGCARVSLVTASGPDGAGPYYERRGWLPRGETRTPEGRLLATYDVPLTSPRSSGPRSSGPGR